MCWFAGRNIELTDLERWSEVERFYKCVRLYNTMYLNWMRNLLAPAIFLWCAAITILLYVTFPPSGLPLLVSCWFLLVAVVSAFIITWLFFDPVGAKREADEVQATNQFLDVSNSNSCTQSHGKSLN